MIKYRILPHTADIRLEIVGKNRKELFRNAVDGLNKIMVAESCLHFDGREKINVGAAELKFLLVDFLNEIVSRAQINKKIYKISKISFSEKDGGVFVSADLESCKTGNFKEDVKAVTYHELEIKESEKGLKALVVMDI